MTTPTKRGGYHLPFRYHRALRTGKLYDRRYDTSAGGILLLWRDPTLMTVRLDAQPLPSATARQRPQPRQKGQVSFIGAGEPSPRATLSASDTGRCRRRIDRRPAWRSLTCRTP
jgi:hypothetical protein